MLRVTERSPQVHVRTCCITGAESRLGGKQRDAWGLQAARRALVNHVSRLTMRASVPPGDRFLAGAL